MNSAAYVSAVIVDFWNVWKVGKEGRVMKHKLFTAFWCVMALLSFGINSTVEAKEPTAEQTAFIKAECQKYALDYGLVYGVIQAESNFDLKADSGSSKGVMQLNKNTYPHLAEDLGITDFDAFDFEDNVQAGVYHLNNMRTYWQEEGYCDEEVFVLMLISYNRGIGGCRKYLDRNGIKDDSYVQKVWQYKTAWEQSSDGYE